jgi:hypothetical protein
MAWAGDPFRQIFIPPPLTLCTFTGGGVEAPVALPPFLVMTPDSRLRTKVTLLFSGLTSVPAPLGSLYLAEVEQDFGGPSAQLLDSVAIEGTAAAPTSLPKNPTLLGYSKEFVTAGDAIRGYLTVGSGINGGSIVLQARWQPDGQRFPPEEWDEVKRLCSLVASTVSL